MGAENPSCAAAPLRSRRLVGSRAFPRAAQLYSSVQAVDAANAIPRHAIICHNDTTVPPTQQRHSICSQCRSKKAGVRMRCARIYRPLRTGCRVSIAAPHLAACSPQSVRRQKRRTIRSESVPVRAVFGSSTPCDTVDFSRFRDHAVRPTEASYQLFLAWVFLARRSPTGLLLGSFWMGICALEGLRQMLFGGWVQTCVGLLDATVHRPRRLRATMVRCEGQSNVGRRRASG